MNLAHWLARQALRNPQAAAVFHGRVQVASYAQFYSRAQGVAGWLRAQGVARGDRVAIFMGNTPEYLFVLYGIWVAGAVAVPINAKLHAKEAAFVLQDADVALTFASADLARVLSDVVPNARVVNVAGPVWSQIILHPYDGQIADRGAEDLAWLFYTSGTTGKPKGVMITHGMLHSMALCYDADVDPVRAEDAALYAAPLSHGAGLYSLMHVRAGARHVLPESGGFDPAEIFDLAAAFGSVHMFAAPTMVRRMTDAARAKGATGAGLRTVVYAGGPMYRADILAAVAQFGPVFVQIYGQGECPMGITVLPRADVADRVSAGWQERLGSVGFAQSAVEVRIAGPDGAEAAAGTVGEILVRGQTVMPGYWRNPQATAQTLCDGWLRTGDMGSMDAAGYVTLQDRSKDVIITGGSNVYPREVEDVLLMLEEVTEVSVVGRVHPEWGEEVVAFVVGTATEAQMQAQCLAHIARFKRPKHYIRLPELPKNNYGKVLKTALREML